MRGPLFGVGAQAFRAIFGGEDLSRRILLELEPFPQRDLISLLYGLLRKPG